MRAPIADSIQWLTIPPTSTSEKRVPALPKKSETSLDLRIQFKASVPAAVLWRLRLPAWKAAPWRASLLPLAHLGSTRGDPDRNPSFRPEEAAGGLHIGLAQPWRIRPFLR